MGFLRKVDRALLRLQRFLAIAGGVFIVLGVSCGALFRYVLDSSFHGLDELMVIAAFWMYFMGASCASYEKKHITAEAFSVYCTNALLRKLVAFTAAAITFGLSALYTVWGWDFLRWSLEAGGETTRLQIPLAVGQSAVFIGFTLMTWYFFVDLLSQSKSLFLPAKPLLKTEKTQSDLSPGC
ncbi:TRAP transporter small permease [Marinobacterium rhizophilum]|uniref:TRAP transporter small permease protein n=1 Tax=Marinobacterium rhizophilum TaxID=420402 RepID=A0ABY5HIF2_9GAMM|nr:TRAP transporter small permease [Marinobacterium rhizophilum]UTW11636.1 TRAP transporter small permease [Marinobacterium rhizophilum]